MRILIVEDERLLADSIKALLESSKYVNVFPKQA